jgi:hypothetical protein
LTATRAGAGRREFGRVVLTSLTERARAEVEERRARGQRLRTRRALRRLAELERALADLEQGLPPRLSPWYARPGAFALVNLLFIGTLGALAAAVVLNGPSGAVVGVFDIAMLIAALVWFTACVLRRGGSPPSNGGSPAGADRR